MTYSKLKLVFLIFVGMVIVIMDVSCDRVVLDKGSTEERRNSSTTPFPVITLSKTATPKLATAILTSTSTSYPTVTTIPKIMYSITPLATLPSQQAHDILINMFQTNGGCKFPCWWGNIVPGYSSWRNTEAYLGTLSPRKGKGTSTRVNEIKYWYEFPLAGEVKPGVGLWAVFTIYKDTITEIKYLTDMPLNKILTDFGKPGEICMDAESAYTIADFAYYTLALYYPEQGVMFTIYGEAPRQKVVQICPGESEDGVSGVMLWNPTQTSSCSELMVRYIGDFQYPPVYNPLEGATGMDINTFYNTYKDTSNASTCFDWQDPDWP